MFNCQLVPNQNEKLDFSFILMYICTHYYFFNLTKLKFLLVFVKSSLSFFFFFFYSSKDFLYTK